MNPRFQRIVDIATIDIENRFQAMIEKWNPQVGGINASRSTGKSPTNDTGQVQPENANPAEPPVQPDATPTVQPPTVR